MSNEESENQPQYERYSEPSNASRSYSDRVRDDIKEEKKAFKHKFKNAMKDMKKDLKRAAKDIKNAGKEIGEYAKVAADEVKHESKKIGNPFKPKHAAPVSKPQPPFDSPDSPEGETNVQPPLEYCPECGFHLQSSSKRKFCPQCGAHLH